MDLSVIGGGRGIKTTLILHEKFASSILSSPFNSPLQNRLARLQNLAEYSGYFFGAANFTVHSRASLCALAIWSGFKFLAKLSWLFVAKSRSAPGEEDMAARMYHFIPSISS